MWGGLKSNNPKRPVDAALMKAIDEEDVGAIKEALRAGADPNVESGGGFMGSPESAFARALTLANNLRNLDVIHAFLASPKLKLTSEALCYAMSNQQDGQLITDILDRDVLRGWGPEMWKEAFRAGWCWDGSHSKPYCMHALLAHPRSAPFRADPQLYAEGILDEVLYFESRAFANHCEPQIVLQQIFSVPDLPINATSAAWGQDSTVLHMIFDDHPQGYGRTLDYVSYKTWSMLKTILHYPGLKPHQKNAEGKSILLMAAAYPDKQVMCDTDDEFRGDVLLETVKTLWGLEPPCAADAAEAIKAAQESGKVEMAEWMLRQATAAQA